MFQIEQSVLRFVAMFKFDIFVDDYKHFFKKIKTITQNAYFFACMYIQSIN